MDRLCHLFILFVFACSQIEKAPGEFLSSGVSHAICNSQLHFTETGKMGEALKTPPKDLPNGCKLFQRTQKPETECTSSPKCWDFMEKSCANLGISEENQYQDSGIGSRNRIVGGREVDPPFKYPSFAYLNASYVNGDEPRTAERLTSCGAVILSESWLLTARHCLRDFGFGIINFGVMAGRHNLSAPDETEQYSDVAEVIFHPNATNNVSEIVDLALVRLETPLKFNQKISAAQLPTKAYLTGDFTIMGLGIYKYDENGTADVPDVPQEANLPAISLERCREISKGNNGYGDDIPDHAICFYREPDGGASSCNGDSGSPAFRIEDGQQILVAVLWAGSGKICGAKNKLSMYMQVFPFLQWIQDNISKSK